MWEPSPILRAIARRLVRDERGAVSILGAMLMMLGLALSVLVVDAGHLYLAKRRLQSAVDAAALAAAGDPAQARTIAANVLAHNGYADSAATVETGLYTADPDLSAAARLDTGAAAPNAVRVTKTVSMPDLLAGFFGVTGLSRVTATATAAQSPVVSFAAGTGLAGVDGGALNTVLGGLLGAKLSLSLASYQALAATHVDALTFLDQLAVEAGVSAGTYGDLASAQVTMGAMLAAARAALDAHPGGNDGAALDALNLLSLQVPSGVSATLGRLVDITLWQRRAIGSIVQQQPAQTRLNLFDLVAAMARIYGNGHLVDLGSTLTLPIANTSVATRLSVGEAMAGAALARKGTAVSTAQVRLALIVTAANVNLGVASVRVTLPLYLQMASGQARVAAIPCRTGGTMTAIAAQSQAASVQIGSVTAAQLADFSRPPQPQAATIASVGISLPLLPPIQVAIHASGTSTLAAGAPTQMNFTQADIDAGTVQTAAGSDTGHLISNLGNSLTLTVPGGLGALVDAVLDGTVMPLLRATLASLLTALDPATDVLLRTIGLRLGAIDVVVRGVHCSAPTLVR